MSEKNIGNLSLNVNVPALPPISLHALYDTIAIGQFIGGRGRNDVLHLIHSGRLSAKREMIRGTKQPRYYAKGEDIIRYINNLDDAYAPRRTKARTRRLEEEEVTEYL